MQSGRFSLSSLSIRHRLPLLIGILLLAIILASTLASYRGVRESALEVGDERLQILTKQLSNLLQQSTAALLTKTFTVANDPAIRAFLKSPSPATQPAASATLEQFTAPQDPLGLQVELWDAKHSLVLTLPNGALPVAVDLEAEFKVASVDPFKTAGPMRVVRDTIAVPAVTAVKDELGKPTGYLVRWRRTSLSPAPRQLADLIGSDAALYFGNNRGDIFTNLERIVPKPQADVGSTLDVMHYSRDGNRVMAQARPIGGTPWFVLVEFPERPFMIQANRFLQRMAIIGVALLGLGIGGAFLLSRNISRPLLELTKAASGISAGDYACVVEIGRQDELGALASAFNTMVITTRESQHTLERKVQERTLQLEAAPCAMLMVDQEGHVALVNAQAEQLFGYDRSELLEHPIEMLVPERYRTAHPGHRRIFSQHPTARAMGGGRDLYGLRKDGSEIPIEIGLNPLTTETGDFVLASIIDLTERKRAEERFRLVVEAAPSAMLMVDERGLMTLVNQQTERLFGYHRDELLGRSIEMLVPGRFRDAHPGHRAGFFADPSTRAMGAGRDLYGLRKDGSEMPIEIGLNPIQTGEGEFVLASIIDITERKRAEERFRLVVEAAPSAMLMVDERGLMTLVNQQTERLFGYHRDELLGRPIEMLVPGRFREAHPEHLADFFARPSTRAMGAGRDLYGLRKDGSEVPVEIGLNPIKTDQGAFVLASIIDITERRRAEERFRLVVEAAPSAMLMVDERGLMTLVNQQTERLFGYHRDELLGRSIEMLVPGRFRDAHPGHRAGFFADPSTRAMGAGRDLYGLRKDGTEVPIEIGLNPIRTGEGAFVLASIIDITERKRAEQVLRQSEERLHTIIENLSEGLVISDLKGQLLHWNQTGLKMHGFSSMEEWLLKIPEFERIFELSALDGSVLEFEQWPLPRIINGEHLADYTVRLRRIDMDWSRVFSYRGGIIEEPNGQPLAFVTITDITESKRSEEELRRSQQQLASIIGSAMDAVITIDDEQRIVLFNGAAERMFLFPSEDAVGQPIDRFIPERFRAAHRVHVKHFGETHVTKRSMGTLGPLYGLRTDGEEFPLEASISQVESDGRRLYTVILRDITERKRADESLKEQARILDMAPVMIRDLAGRILFWNTGIERMYGWKAEEALEKISDKLLKTEFPLPLEEIKIRLLADGYWEGEVLQTRKDGRRIDVASHWALHRDEHHKPKAVLVVNNDITERRQAEREILRLNEELEQRVAERTVELKAANKELEAFSYSVSHDLRAPLRHINGFSQALLEDYADRLDDYGKNYLQEVRNASQEMAQLIDDVLQLARVSRSEMRREEVDLSETARAVLAALQKMEPERRVSVSIAEDLRTHGDKRLLKIMLNNLLGNAWKFTSRCNSPTVVFGELKHNGETSYFVRDNGAGFDMAYANKLFGAFQRLHTAGEFEGTGIGLATVQRIVNRHGGRVWAEGAVNVGATFYFTLANSKEQGDERQSDPIG